MSYYILVAKGNPEEFCFSGNDLERIKGFFIKYETIINEMTEGLYEVRINGRVNKHVYNIKANSVEEVAEIILKDYVTYELVE